MSPLWSNRTGLLAGVIAVGVLVTLWAFSDAFVSAEARDCLKRYEAARTAADTAAVDSIIPAGRYKSQDTRTCAVRSINARWFTRH